MLFIQREINLKHQRKYKIDWFHWRINRVVLHLLIVSRSTGFEYSIRVIFKDDNVSYVIINWLVVWYWYNNNLTTCH